MANKRAYDEMFIEGTIQTVAEIGIENMRTKDVANYTGFSESTMFRRFPTKEILLRETFLYVDKEISDLLTQSKFIHNPEDTSFETGVYFIWHEIYRYLIRYREKTIFLIRFRYSSSYTEEVRSMRQANNGGFDQVYSIFKKYIGCSDRASRELLIDYIFEMTLCFSEKIIAGRLEDN